ncbi:MAG: heme ABC transporter ATP-binding protein, partial [Anaerolinea sp. 4484_236]
MKDIVIRFPGVLANDHVNLTLRKGEIHALLGENGAGKSTLMNALAGLYKPVSGTTEVNGELVDFNSPKDAIAKGIGMVHQHFKLVPTHTVTENILLGMDEPRFFMRLKKYNKKILELEELYGLYVDPEAKIWQLPVGAQQRVEILKILYRGAEILIMDEPTAVLAPQEIDDLMATMRSMAEQGKSIIFISHKLHEVTAVADRVTVLRKGKVTAQREAGPVVLTMKDVHAKNNKGLPALRGVSLRIHKGEILGIAGVGGNGQSELAEVITGLRECEGLIEINGEEISNQPPIIAIECGVSHIPEDRTAVGSAPSLSITENAIMKGYCQDPIGNGWSINFAKAGEHARNLKEKYNILAPNVKTPAGKLSGGNLQKLILAREISSAPRLIVAMQPTRGLDVGAIEA